MPLHLLYRFFKFLVSTERQSFGGGRGEMRSCYRRTTTWLRTGTGVPFIDPCILLQFATIIQILQAVI